jgi:LruC domain-containing protein
MVNVYLEGPSANAYVNPDTTQITVTLLNNGVAPSGGVLLLNELPSSAFNPYLIVGDTGSWDQIRAKEIHLPNRVPTSKASAVYWGMGHDNSIPASGRYYKTIENLPWALDIYNSVPYMQEKRDISTGYSHFIEWATSIGTQFQNWYQNVSGYRTNSNLYIR